MDLIRDGVMESQINSILLILRGTELPCNCSQAAHKEVISHLYLVSRPERFICRSVDLTNLQNQSGFEGQSHSCYCP